MSVSQRKLQKNALFCFFSIYDENFHLLRSGDKKSSTVLGCCWGDIETIGRFPKWIGELIDKDNKEYPTTSRGNGRIMLFARMRFGGNRQREAMNQ